MYSSDKLFWHSLECYFDVYFPPRFATREINTKVSLSRAPKQFVTQVHILFSIYPWNWFTHILQDCFTSAGSSASEVMLKDMGENDSCEIKRHYRIKCGNRMTVQVPVKFPESKVHGTNMGPIWGWEDPGGPHVSPWTLLSGLSWRKWVKQTGTIPHQNQ